MIVTTRRINYKMRSKSYTARIKLQWYDRNNKLHVDFEWPQSETDSCTVIESYTCFAFFFFFSFQNLVDKINFHSPIVKLLDSYCRHKEYVNIFFNSIWIPSQSNHFSAPAWKCVQHLHTGNRKQHFISKHDIIQRVLPHQM